MAKIFNNINKSLYPAESSLHLSGWEKTMAYDTNRVPHITDTVGSGIALSKMGTSIPTPFARIFLFKTAFEMVNGSADGADDNSAYGKLVSECLDFLEFIYLYGDAINLKTWNVNGNITALKNSPSKGHKILGKSLENFALNLGVKDIYLIYYNGVLIGGTSPFTLVYTSPNWQRVKNITNACGLAGNQLFPDYSQPNTVATPLYKRDLGFRTMLTRYYVAFCDVPGMSATSFFKYIYRNQFMYDEEMKEYFADITGKAPYDVAMFRNDYACVKANMTEIDILGMGGAQTLFLATKTATPVPGPNPGPDPSPNATISDDYKIAATVDNGNVNRPLVLFEGGITGATYVADKPLPNGVDIVRNPDEPLDSRILPGGQNIKYPYLTDTDFLQEKIIKVGYKVDTDNFMTFGIQTAGDGDYLLPLRKEIFEFFKPSDFVDDSVHGLSIKLEELDKETVKVHLTIPVQFKGRPYIELVHTYYKDDIVELKNYPNVFSIGVFPSYRILGNAVPNIYSVLVLDAKKQVTTRYYAFNDGKVEVVADVVSKRRLTNGGRYDELKQTFDICEVETNEAKALLLPNFKEITPADGGGKTVVGIDFGTTNTYISFSTDDGGEPKSLDITRDDMQVLMLNKINLDKGNFGDDYRNSMYMMSPYITSLDREFVPLLLGDQSNVAYPFRTVTCEVNDSQNGFDKIASPQLFADINIGFNFLKEFVDLPKEKYNTNIKWDIEEGNTDEPLAVKQNRVRAFCYQNAWMIKNKLMLLQAPRTSFTVFITFPYTMKRTVRNDIAAYWLQAFDMIMGKGNVEIERVTESIAPYYSMISNDGNFTDNALNIDIGGGTTDMLFADVEHMTFYYTSSKFAGDDIWGDGKHLVDNNKKDNGFVKDFETKLASHSLLVSEDRSRGYEQYKSLVNKSADLMSYIFRYEDEFKYTGYIRQSKDKLMPVLCVHLGAIIYHVAQVLTERHITIPSTITFSGMGAKYIHIISDNESDVQDIVEVLLSAFMESLSGDKCKMPRNFNVRFQNNAKEVTAQGAMLLNHDSLQDIRDYDKEPLCVFGIDKEISDELEYKDVPKYKNDVLKSYDKFLDAFVRDKKITRFFKEEFGIIFTDELVKKLENEASQSFDLMSRNADANTNYVSETMFFWPLKNGLYAASK
ncbi:hypothetical protein [uncultured Prevotella sp.]|uniref:hypothetical protein n=1 Tax=uncultured Prevotella sp. TaxID=159272 RepID=UPI0025F0468C|nr:hypothetical protein [uncultured Prevotella sp.]